ncbi:probable G-protein coupled receptor 101 [Erinaceus europaeus]|uniref:Probable G-protein coupled receptor 101 n=1 Tax=Erinaceus europaeus TaxID=9365 RepID=A0A1S2ZU90_ERIEU|nr:probable G-protein coupled receptor 101 [Erinaceus europaeus]
MPISLAHGIIRSCVLVVFLTVSFFGNIVLAFVLQRKPQLLQVTNRFIFNLLITDLLQISLVAPWVVATSVPFFWPLNTHFCTALVSLTHLFAFASVNTIVVVSIDRYLSIIHPLSYPNKMTQRRGYMLLYGTWILAILQSTPPLYGWGQAAFDERNALCSMIWGASPSYAIISVLFFLVIPLSVMIACYSVVFGAARRQHALLYFKSHSLEVQAKKRGTEGKKDEFHGESEIPGLSGGEVRLQESSLGATEGSSVLAKDGSMETIEGGQITESSFVAMGDILEEAEAGGSGSKVESSSVKARKECKEATHCSIDLGEDDINLDREEDHFRDSEDVEAVNIPERLSSSRRNSESDIPLPRCYECKAAKVIFMIIFSYVLSLGPYCFLAVLALWVDTETQVPQWVITIIIWLFFLQCCIHPYIYGYMHKTIKKEIQDLLKRLFCRERTPQEDSHPDLAGTDGGTDGGTEGRVIPSHDSATLP